MTSHYLGLSKQVTHAGSALCQNSEWDTKPGALCTARSAEPSLQAALPPCPPHTTGWVGTVSRALRESECYSQTYLNTIKKQQRLKPLRCFIPPLSRPKTNSLYNSRFSRAQRLPEQSVNTLKLCVSIPQFLPFRDQGPLL